MKKEKQRVWYLPCLWYVTKLRPGVEPLKPFLFSLTNLEGRCVYKDTWKEADRAHWQAFIGLLILAGVYKSKGKETASLWAAEAGRKILFPCVISCYDRETSSLKTLLNLMLPSFYQLPKTVSDSFLFPIFHSHGGLLSLQTVCTAAIYFFKKYQKVNSYFSSVAENQVMKQWIQPPPGREWR